mgnify:CR=1 FL=1
MRINSISIIFPFYNEESRLNQCFKDINAFNKNNKEKDKEYIFVDDGSNDNSLKLIKHFINKQNNKKVKYKLISINKNTGKGFALKKGVRAAKKKWILTLDTDISVSLSQINIWIKKNYINNKKKEIYFGSRNGIGSIVNYKFYRKIFGSIFIFLIKNFLKIKMLDTQCGYKLYPNLLAKKVGNLFIKTSISTIIMINTGTELNPTISIAAAINMPNKSKIKYFICFLEQIFLISCIIGY